MPINKRYPIKELLKASVNFPVPPRKALMFEYVMLSGVNDSDKDAYDLGNLLATAGMVGDAESSYRRALELDATNEAARFNLALLEHESGRLDDAVVDYSMVVEARPAHAWAHYLLGSIHDSRNRRRQAVAAYAEAFALDRQLLYPDVNPHIIDNRYVTEALLRSREVRRHPQAPRAYADAARIEALLLQQVRIDPLATEEGASQNRRKGADERVLDEDALADVPEINQLEDGGKRNEKKRKRRR